ncbi:hypothetical protein GCM10022234_27740 [Aeromicrobium panaciterrae]|uniref:hypothetical protein n=1 Tax=Aeromicrobium panaciterrae TaxID=363861 RepID=UPI0031E44BB5
MPGRRDSRWQVARYETGIERWTNSWFGRLLCTALGLFGVVAGVATPVLNVFLLAVPGALLLLSVWTAKLEIADGVLFARDFGRVRSIPLDQIAEAEPALFGIRFRADDGRWVRSLVSGEQGNELWVTRAQRICDEVMRRADGVRPA